MEKIIEYEVENYVFQGKLYKLKKKVGKKLHYSCSICDCKGSIVYENDYTYKFVLEHTCNIADKDVSLIKLILDYEQDVNYEFKSVDDFLKLISSDYGNVTSLESVLKKRFEVINIKKKPTTSIVDEIIKYRTKLSNDCYKFTDESCISVPLFQSLNNSQSSIENNVTKKSRTTLKRKKVVLDEPSLRKSKRLEKCDFSLFKENKSIKNHFKSTKNMREDNRTSVKDEQRLDIIKNESKQNSKSNLEDTDNLTNDKSLSVAVKVRKTKRKKLTEPVVSTAKDDMHKMEQNPVRSTSTESGKDFEEAEGTLVKVPLVELKKMEEESVKGVIANQSVLTTDISNNETVQSDDLKELCHQNDTVNVASENKIDKNYGEVLREEKSRFAENMVENTESRNQSKQFCEAAVDGEQIISKDINNNEESFSKNMTEENNLNSSNEVETGMMELKESVTEHKLTHNKSINDLDDIMNEVIRQSYERKLKLEASNADKSVKRQSQKNVKLTNKIKKTNEETDIIATEADKTVCGTKKVKRYTSKKLEMHKAADNIVLLNLKNKNKLKLEPVKKLKKAVLKENTRKALKKNAILKNNNNVNAVVNEEKLRTKEKLGQVQSVTDSGRKSVMIELHISDEEN